jgi:hypothetical protein
LGLAEPRKTFLKNGKRKRTDELESSSDVAEFILWVLAGTWTGSLWLSLEVAVSMRLTVSLFPDPTNPRLLCGLGVFCPRPTAKRGFSIWLNSKRELPVGFCYLAARFRRRCLGLAEPRKTLLKNG